MSIYTSDLSPHVPTPGVWPVLFLEDRPAVLALPIKADVEGVVTVQALSYNTFKPIGSVEISFAAPPGDPQGAPATRRPGQRTPRPSNRSGQGAGGLALYADARNHNLLCARGSSVAVIPLASLNLPDEPLLQADVAGPTTIELGKPLTLELKRADPRARIELRSGPEGMRLDGDRLTWTPASPEAVGTFAVALRVFAGDVERVQELRLTVRRPAVDLPFVPDDLRVSADGRAAVILLRGQDPQRPRPDANAAAQPGAQLAVIDLAKRDVTARRTLPVDATAVAIDSKFVYVALRDSDAFYVLSRADLADHKRVFTTGRAHQLVPVADRYVYAVTAQDRQGVSRFKLPDFSTDEPPAATRPAAIQGIYRPHPAAPPVPVAGGYYEDGVLFDGELRRPRLLVMPPGFPTLATRAPALQSGAPVQYDHLGRASAPVARWGVSMLPGGNIRRMSGQSIGPGTGVDGALLETAPAAAILRAEPQRGNDDGAARRSRWEIVLRELLTGAPSAPIVLQDEPISREMASRYAMNGGDGRATRLVAQPDGGLLALIGDRLYVLPPEALPVRDLPVPLHFDLAQDLLAIDPDKPTTLAPVARGGKAPLQFAAAVEFPGVDVDRASGKVTLDPARLRPRAVEAVVSMLQNGYRYTTDPATGRPVEPEQVVAAYAAPAAARFAQIVGRPPRGVPVFVPVPLTVRDAEQQAANFDGGVFLEIPADVLVAPLRDRAQRVRGPNESVRGVPIAVTRPVGDAASDVAALRRRIAELEQRNQQLEAQVQLLKELVQGRPARDGGNKQP